MQLSNPQDESNKRLKAMVMTHLSEILLPCAVKNAMVVVVVIFRDSDDLGQHSNNDLTSSISVEKLIVMIHQVRVQSWSTSVFYMESTVLPDVKSTVQTSKKAQHPRNHKGP